HRDQERDRDNCCDDDPPVDRLVPRRRPLAGLLEPVLAGLEVCRPVVVRSGAAKPVVGIAGAVHAEASLTLPMSFAAVRGLRKRGAYSPTAAMPILPALRARARGAGRRGRDRSATA